MPAISRCGPTWREWRRYRSQLRHLVGGLRQLERWSPARESGRGHAHRREYCTSLTGRRVQQCGPVAFVARLTGSGVNSTNDQGLWSAAPGVWCSSRQREPGPGTPSGVNYLSLSPPPIRCSTTPVKIAFRAILTGTGVNSTNDLGIWSDGSGALAHHHTCGDQAPGTATVQTFPIYISPR